MRDVYRASLSKPAYYFEITIYTESKGVLKPLINEEDRDIIYTYKDDYREYMKAMNEFPQSLHDGIAPSHNGSYRLDMSQEERNTYVQNKSVLDVCREYTNNDRYAGQHSFIQYKHHNTNTVIAQVTLGDKSSFLTPQSERPVWILEGILKDPQRTEKKVGLAILEKLKTLLQNKVKLSVSPRAGNPAWIGTLLQFQLDNNGVEKVQCEDNKRRKCDNYKFLEVRMPRFEDPLPPQLVELLRQRDEAGGAA